MRSAASGIVLDGKGVVGSEPGSEPGIFQGSRRREVFSVAPDGIEAAPRPRGQDEIGA